MRDLADFEPDRRGNVLRAWALRGEGDSVRVHLRAAFAVAKHVRTVLAYSGGNPRTAPYPVGEGWTHCYEISREIPELPDLLAAFERCLILQDLPTELDTGMALDFYKIPLEGVDSFSWPNTDIGELINKMKYRDDPVTSSSAREALVDDMVSLIEVHPIYRTATLISVPGHDATVTAPSELLAMSIGNRLGKEITRAKSKRLLRPETKSLKGKVDLRSEFIVPQDGVGYTALILDDVYGRGSNMQGVAAAARASGAREVHGLVAARTVT